MSKLYKESGVDLEAGYESVRLIKSHVERTSNQGTFGNIGAFGGLFNLSNYSYKEPILVSGTDGVGTKLLLSIKMDKHDTIGIDAVAMCVNDVIVQGAIPLFFLDYLAVGNNNPRQIEQLVRGVADGCVLSECALIGGETAEMPDVYDKGHYDIAGFCVGAVEKDKLITGDKIKENDVVIGLSSSGCHSNGFSLIRKVLLKDAGMNLNDYIPSLEKTLGEELLTPTRIYVKSIKKLLDNQLDIHGMAHITGGGFYENLPRMLPEGLGVEINTKLIDTPKIFDLIQEVGHINRDEMYNVFNMGIGYVIVVDKNDVSKTLSLLEEEAEHATVIGRITDSKKVVLK